MPNSSDSPVQKTADAFSNLQEKASGALSDLKDRASEAGEQISDKAADAYADLKDRASHASDAVSEKASSTYADLKDKAAQAGGTVSDKAHQVLADATVKADGALHKVGEKLVDASGSLAKKTPESGVLTSPLNAVATQMETSGNYLVNHGVGDIADDLTGLIRKYPVHSMWVGVALGVLLGSAISSRK